MLDEAGKARAHLQGIGVPYHGHEERGGDEKARDGAVGEHNLRASASRGGSAYTSRGGSACTSSGAEHLCDAPQRGVGEADEEVLASDPLEELGARDAA